MSKRLDFPPQKLVNLEDGRKLILGMNGELQILDNNLLPLQDKKIPFPTTISHSSVSSDKLFAFWIDLELMIARMAAFNLNEDIPNGPSRSELRSELKNLEIDSFKGAIWSHSLDSEPLAIVSNGEFIFFTTWKRGIYCIDHDSNEIWRIPSIKWNNNIIESHLIIKMYLNESELVVWTKGSEWAKIDFNNGNLIEQGEFEFLHSLDRVYYFDNKILLCSVDGHISWIEDYDISNSLSIKEKGPVNYALWDSETDSWRLCVWRKDIMWSKSSIQTKNRNEIGKSIFKHEGEWMVLDNSGNFSKHLE